MLALHLVQGALVYLNTLLVQRVLLDEKWAMRLPEEDRRGISPANAATRARGQVGQEPDGSAYAEGGRTGDCARCCVRPLLRDRHHLGSEREVFGRCELDRPRGPERPLLRA